MHENHSIKVRVSFNFPSYLNEIELDWEQFQDWNERENNQASYIQIKLDLDISTKSSKRRKKIYRERKKNDQKFFFCLQRC